MTNPLIQAYRKPALYIALPSKGNFYKKKPKLSIDNELAVYAMTARDELITKTPDALFNGEATISLIRSCCPDIDRGFGNFCCRRGRLGGRGESTRF